MATRAQSRERQLITHPAIPSAGTISFGNRDEDEDEYVDAATSADLDTEPRS